MRCVSQAGGEDTIRATRFAFGRFGLRIAITIAGYRSMGGRGRSAYRPGNHLMAQPRTANSPARRRWKVR